MKFGLTTATLEAINSVFIKHPEVEQAIIYGSRAKGNYRTASDIDLTIKGVGLNAIVLSKIKQEIDELNTPYLFDISIFETLNTPELVEQISRVGKLFYERPVLHKNITQ